MCESFATLDPFLPRSNNDTARSNFPARCAPSNHETTPSADVKFTSPTTTTNRNNDNDDATKTVTTETTTPPTDDNDATTTTLPTTTTPKPQASAVDVDAATTTPPDDDNAATTTPHDTTYDTTTHPQSLTPHQLPDGPPTCNPWHASLTNFFQAADHLEEAIADLSAAIADLSATITTISPDSITPVYPHPPPKQLLPTPIHHQKPPHQTSPHRQQLFWPRKFHPFPCTHSTFIRHKPLANVRTQPHLSPSFRALLLCMAQHRYHPP